MAKQPSKTDIDARRRKRTLVISVDGEGRMICKFKIKGRMTSQCSYLAENDRLEIKTGIDGAYGWLAGKINLYLSGLRREHRKHDATK